MKSEPGKHLLGASMKLCKALSGCGSIVVVRIFVAAPVGGLEMVLNPEFPVSIWIFICVLMFFLILCTRKGSSVVVSP